MPLGVTAMPLGGGMAAFEAAAAMGLRGVQLDAADPSMRPRELGDSGRRDLAAALRRRGLVASGIDCLVPVERFADAAAVERAMDAVRGSIALAESLQGVPVCVHLPRGDGEVPRALRSEALRRGVPLADIGVPPDAGEVCVDPAALLAASLDVSSTVAGLSGRVAAARVVDLLRSGLRGPIGEPGAGRLDAMAYRLALELAGFRGLPVIDARQWTDVPAQVARCAERWMALLPAMPGAAA
jgi:sugar phosphate isomerase/epimerase